METDSPTCGNRQQLLLLSRDPSEIARFAGEFSSRYAVSPVQFQNQAMRELADRHFDLLVIDAESFLHSIEALVPDIRRLAPVLPVVCYGGATCAEAGALCVQNGASSFFRKPWEHSEVIRHLAAALNKPRAQHYGCTRTTSRNTEADSKELFDFSSDHIKQQGDESRLIGSSDTIGHIKKLIDSFSKTNFPILIVGETGTGKDIIASEIHRNSLRKENPYRVLNCMEIPEALLESHLFGTEAGAFTGAREHPGILEEAQNGTLFIDEIGELPESVQVKLLRCLENREGYRLGSGKKQLYNFRLISATNKDLLGKGNTLREDLLQRISTCVIPVVPLAERKSDIPLLVHHFLMEQKHCGQFTVRSEERRVGKECISGWSRYHEREKSGVEVDG